MLYEKQNFSSVLTLICDYAFRLSFPTTLDIEKDILRVVKVYTSYTSVEQSLFKQFVTGDRVCPSSSLIKKLLCLCTVGFYD